MKRMRRRQDTRQVSPIKRLRSIAPRKKMMSPIYRRPRPMRSMSYQDNINYNNMFLLIDEMDDEKKPLNLTPKNIPRPLTSADTKKEILQEIKLRTVVRDSTDLKTIKIAINKYNTDIKENIRRMTKEVQGDKKIQNQIREKLREVLLEKQQYINRILSSPPGTEQEQKQIRTYLNSEEQNDNDILNEYLNLEDGRKRRKSKSMKRRKRSKSDGKRTSKKMSRKRSKSDGRRRSKKMSKKMSKKRSHKKRKSLRRK